MFEDVGTPFDGEWCDCHDLEGDGIIDLMMHFKTDDVVEALELNRENLVRILEKADILVNATSVGMSPDINETPVDSDLLRPDLVVYDIVNNPIKKTRLLREAEIVGAKTISGVDMLVWQGAIAFEMWTGRKALVEIMKEALIKLL